MEETRSCGLLDSEDSPNNKSAMTFKILSNEDDVSYAENDKETGYNSKETLCSEEDEAPMIRTKRRIKQFSDSESEGEVAGGNEGKTNKSNNQSEHEQSDLQKSCLRKMSSSEEDSISDLNNTLKEVQQESRINDKQNKLKQKFKTLLKSRPKKDTKATSATHQSETSVVEGNAESENSDDEASIRKIREIIKEKMMALKSSLFDPDTSDEESSLPNLKPEQKKGQKHTKLTSPKPIRMSAKQAIENMQKIKSESNRMLREKEVSLPYHRPKALSLKDIMSRRRPAVSADGKALPIKMNKEQLKQYVQHLQQRQKEVIELCKSESEEEETEENEKIDHVSSLNDTLYDDLAHSQIKLDTNATDHQDTLQDSSTETTNKVDKVLTLTKGSFEDEVLLLDFDLVKTNTEISEGGQDILNSENTLRVIEAHEIMTTELNESKSKDQGNNVSVNNSAERALVYNDSVEELCEEGTVEKEVNKENEVSAKNDTEAESQLISLHYDSDKMENDSVITKQIEEANNEHPAVHDLPINAVCDKNNGEKTGLESIQNCFSDDEMDMEDIDALIEKAELIASQHPTENVTSPMLMKDAPLKTNPKLTGAPGMVIDLDGTDPFTSKKLTGVELLKERFIYFAKLKSPEEMTRQREKTIKPGTQHLKLKQELEEQIAEQRSLEWAKRLENDKQHQNEIDAMLGDGSDAEEDIDKIDAKLEENGDAVEQESSSESEDEEELEQDTIEKPRKRNPMLDDEAEESEESDCDVKAENRKEVENGTDEGNDADDDDEEDESENESSDESEESESEQRKPKKGRILKAFEDSDDEDTLKPMLEDATSDENINTNNDIRNSTISQAIKDTQDDEIQLAQEHKAFSDDLFTSQESRTKLTNENVTLTVGEKYDDKDLGTQTFSILESTVEKNDQIQLSLFDKLFTVCNNQSYDDNLDTAVVLCSGRFSQSQNLVTPTQTQYVESEPSQVIGDDVLALCTGQFYDNQFVSQGSSYEISQGDGGSIDKEITLKGPIDDEILNDRNDSRSRKVSDIKTSNNCDLILESRSTTLNNDHKNTYVQNKIEDSDLKSILDELNDPEFDIPKPCKYFVGNDTQDKENKVNVANTLKKKFIIDSDDEEGAKVATEGKKLKVKRKKLEKRALQISDDEEDEKDDEQLDQEEVEECESEKEDGNAEKLVEYDDEENEIEVKPQDPKKKRKVRDFFENEAELTSEDEWVGSGDEDERGLDRMEREAGDDDAFNQAALQRELGQIHMRDVLDQDKREVRLIQELLFEDGDLGDGHRQRKFRWKDADGAEVTGIPYNELPDTQEEEFESEEQWRKQRHEREMFLKSLKSQEQPEDTLNTSVNRTSIIKANLSKNTNSVLVGMNTSVEKIDTPVEKKTAKDIPSPKKPFTMFQGNYHSSLLTRGGGALARLAALATPLANDDDAPAVGSFKPANNRNFVFTAVDAKELIDEPKITKRKADKNVDTPRLAKKMRTEEKQKYPKSSLLDYIKT